MQMRDVQEISQMDRSVLYRLNAMKMTMVFLYSVDVVNLKKMSSSLAPLPLSAINDSTSLSNPLLQLPVFMKEADL